MFVFAGSKKTEHEGLLGLFYCTRTSPLLLWRSLIRHSYRRQRSLHAGSKFFFYSFCLASCDVSAFSECTSTTFCLASESVMSKTTTTFHRHWTLHWAQQKYFCLRRVILFCSTETTMGFGLQLRLLLWKNFTLKKRAPVSLLWSWQLFPIVFMTWHFILLLALRTSIFTILLCSFCQITVLIEVLIPLVLFLILMSIRFRREPDFVPEGRTKQA